MAASKSRSAKVSSAGNSMVVNSVGAPDFHFAYCAFLFSHVWGKGGSSGQKWLKFCVWRVRERREKQSKVYRRGQKRAIIAHFKSGVLLISPEAGADGVGRKKEDNPDPVRRTPIVVLPDCIGRSPARVGCRV